MVETLKDLVRSMTGRSSISKHYKAGKKKEEINLKHRPILAENNCIYYSIIRDLLRGRQWFADISIDLYNLTILVGLLPLSRKVLVCISFIILYYFALS